MCDRYVGPGLKGKDAQSSGHIPLANFHPNFFNLIFFFYLFNLLTTEMSALLLTDREKKKKTGWEI